MEKKRQDPTDNAPRYPRDATKHLTLAAEAISMAKSATDPDQRTRMLAIADHWIKAARMLQLEEEIRRGRHATDALLCAKCGEEMRLVSRSDDNQASAEAEAVKQFTLNPEQRKRLVVIERG